MKKQNINNTLTSNVIVSVYEINKFKTSIQPPHLDSLHID